MGLYLVWSKSIYSYKAKMFLLYIKRCTHIMMQNGRWWIQAETWNLGQVPINPKKWVPLWRSSDGWSCFACPPIISNPSTTRQRPSEWAPHVDHQAILKFWEPFVVGNFCLITIFSAIFSLSVFSEIHERRKPDRNLRETWAGFHASENPTRNQRRNREPERKNLVFQVTHEIHEKSGKKKNLLGLF